jgi:hypothetical protein
MEYNFIKKIHTKPAITPGEFFGKRFLSLASPEAYYSILCTLFIDLYILPHIFYIKRDVGCTSAFELDREVTLLL